MHMILGNEIMQKKVFVTRAIHRLCENGDASRGIHTSYSGLFGALHLYYGDEETPCQMIWNLIKSGDILAEKVRGGLQIYDPKVNVAVEHPHVFAPAVFRFVGLGQLGLAESSKITKTISTRLAKIFDYTEAALLCKVIRLRANRMIKASKGDTRTIDVSWSRNNNAIYITIFLNPKRGKVEFIFYPSCENNCEKIARACKTALHFNSSQSKVFYVLKEQYRDSAEDVIDTVTHERIGLNFGATKAKKIIVAYANEFNRDNCIPKNRLREILYNEVHADRHVIKKLIQTFTSGELPLLVKMNSEDIKKCHMEGYMLTRHASYLIMAAHAD